MALSSERSFWNLCFGVLLQVESFVKFSLLGGYLVSMWIKLSQGLRMTCDVMYNNLL